MMSDDGVLPVRCHLSPMCLMLLYRSAVSMSAMDVFVLTPLMFVYLLLVRVCGCGRQRCLGCSSLCLKMLIRIR